MLLLKLGLREIEVTAGIVGVDLLFDHPHHLGLNCKPDIRHAINKHRMCRTIST